MDTYCEGMNCSKRDTCKKHLTYLDGEEMHEYIDYSTQGSGMFTNKGCDVAYMCGDQGNFNLYEKTVMTPDEAMRDINKLRVQPKQINHNEISHDDFSLIQCANCHSHGIEITLDENDYLNLKCKWCGVSSTLKLNDDSSILKYKQKYINLKKMTNKNYGSTLQCDIIYKNMWEELSNELIKMKNYYFYHDNYLSARENVYCEDLCEKILTLMDEIKTKFNERKEQ